MGLSEPVDRSLSHIRRIKCEGYARADGMLDIEGELRDTKSYDFPSSTHGTLKAGEHIHHMQVRITIDFSLTIRDAEAVTLSGPYQICPKGAENIGLETQSPASDWRAKRLYPHHRINGPYGNNSFSDPVWRESQSKSGVRGGHIPWTVKYQHTATKPDK